MTFKTQPRGTRAKIPSLKFRFLIVFALVLLSSLALVSASAPVMDGLLGAWYFENDTSDSIGSHNLSTSTEITLNDSHFVDSFEGAGKAVYMNRSWYLTNTDMNYDLGFYPEQSMCISVNPKGYTFTPSSGVFGILDWNLRYHTLQMVFSYAYQYGGVETLRITAEGITDSELTGLNFQNDSGWYHICVGYSRSENNLLLVNHNGTYYNQNVTSATTLSGTYPLLNVGSRVNGVGVGEYYIDNVLIFDRQLTPAEMQNYVDCGYTNCSTSNVAPVVDVVNVTPLSPLDNNTLSVFCNASDANDDNLFYVLQWIKNDVVVKTSYNYSDTYGVIDFKDVVFVNCTANDGVLNSSSVSSNSVSVNLSDYTPSYSSVYSPCDTNITLNSSGVSVLFNWSESTSESNRSMKYDIYIQNSISSYEIQQNLNVTNHNETLLTYPSMSYNTVVQSCDTDGNCRNSSSLCSFELCTSQWTQYTSSCAYNGSSDVWGIQFIYYLDSNNCESVYDVPSDNGTLNTCQLSAPSETTDSSSEQKNVMVFVLYLFLIVAFIVVGTVFPPVIILSGITTIFFSFFIKNTLEEPTVFVIALIFGATMMIGGVLYSFISAKI